MGEAEPIPIGAKRTRPSSAAAIIRRRVRSWIPALASSEVVGRAAAATTTNRSRASSEASARRAWRPASSVPGSRPRRSPRSAVWTICRPSTRAASGLPSLDLRTHRTSPAASGRSRSRNSVRRDRSSRGGTRAARACLRRPGRDRVDRSRPARIGMSPRGRVGVAAKAPERECKDRCCRPVKPLQVVERDHDRSISHCGAKERQGPDPQARGDLAVPRPAPCAPAPDRAGAVASPAGPAHIRQ